MLYASGIVLMQGPRGRQPFDIHTDRKFHDSLKNSVSDPDTLETNRISLTEMVKATFESWLGRKISPVYQRLPHLQEPHWQDLRIGAAKRFWEAHDAWERQLELSRKSGDIGGLLVLAGEAPVIAFRAHATLIKAECFDFASEQLDETLTVESDNLQKPESQWQPRQVLLFSGHMIDAPNRDKPRFPADKEALAAQKIAETLDKLSAGPEDLALTQGACGGDILFAEACRQRGVRLILLQPFEEPAFIQKSVLPGGEVWRNRYFAIKPQAKIKSAPIELGPPPEDVNPYERCNLWLLYTALAYGIEKVRFICLWNGEDSDAPGGTGHMYREVSDKTGQVYWLNTKELE